MLAFDSFRMEEGVPIYLQIMRFVERSIAAGTARDQEELPSRRTQMCIRDRYMHW